MDSKTKTLITVGGAVALAGAVTAIALGYRAFSAEQQAKRLRRQKKARKQERKVVEPEAKPVLVQRTPADVPEDQELAEKLDEAMEVVQRGPEAMFSPKQEKLLEQMAKWVVSLVPSDYAPATRLKAAQFLVQRNAFVVYKSRNPAEQQEAARAMRASMPVVWALLDMLPNKKLSDDIVAGILEMQLNLVLDYHPEENMVTVYKRTEKFLNEHGDVPVALLTAMVRNVLAAGKIESFPAIAKLALSNREISQHLEQLGSIPYAQIPDVQLLQKMIADGEAKAIFPQGNVPASDLKFVAYRILNWTRTAEHIEYNGVPNLQQMEDAKKHPMNGRPVPVSSKNMIRRTGGLAHLLAPELLMDQVEGVAIQGFMNDSKLRLASLLVQPDGRRTESYVLELASTAPDGVQTWAGQYEQTVVPRRQSEEQPALRLTFGISMKLKPLSKTEEEEAMKKLGMAAARQSATGMPEMDDEDLKAMMQMMNGSQGELTDEQRQQLQMLMMMAAMQQQKERS